MPSVRDRMIMCIEGMVDVLGDGYAKGTETRKIIDAAKELLDEHPTRAMRDVVKWQRIVNEQAAWMSSCGGDLAGYIEHYGNPGRDKCYGDGGTAIWKADSDAYAKLLDYRNAAQVKLNLAQDRTPW